MGWATNVCLSRSGLYDKSTLRLGLCECSLFGITWTVFRVICI